MTSTKYISWKPYVELCHPLPLISGNWQVQTQQNRMTQLLIRDG